MKKQKRRKIEGQSKIFKPEETDEKERKVGEKKERRDKEISLRLQTHSFLLRSSFKTAST